MHRTTALLCLCFKSHVRQSGYIGRQNLTRAIGQCAAHHDMWAQLAERSESANGNAPSAGFLTTQEELAHLRERDHNKAFYRLCEHMEPRYHQLEFDTRLYLAWREMEKASGR